MHTYVIRKSWEMNLEINPLTRNSVKQKHRSPFKGKRGGYLSEAHVRGRGRLSEITQRTLHLTANENTKDTNNFISLCRPIRPNNCG